MTSVLEERAVFSAFIYSFVCFVFEGVSSAFRCLGKAALFYCGTASCPSI